jgi:hypothetical protein
MTTQPDTPFIKINGNNGQSFYLRFDRIVSLEIIRDQLRVLTDFKVTDGHLYTVIMKKTSFEAQALMAYFDKLVVFPELSPPITE